MPIRGGKQIGMRRAVKAKTFTRRKKVTSRVATVATVRKMIRANIEKKYWPLNIGSLQVTSAGEVASLTNVPIGDDDSSRVGDQLQIRSIELKWRIRWTNNPDPNVFQPRVKTIRVILFQWKPKDAPIVSDIIQAVVGLGTGAVWNHDRRDLYRILYDKVLKVSAPSTPATIGTTPVDFGTGQGVFETNWERAMITSGFFDRKIQFASSLDTNGSNRIWLLRIADNTTAANSALLDQITKFNYSDG